MNRFDRDTPSSLGAEFEAEFTFETAFEDLTNSRATSVDIENALDSLRGLRRITPAYAKRFLGLAAQQASHWTEEVGVETVLPAILPHLDSLRRTAEATQDEKQKERLLQEHRALSTKIISGTLIGDPSSYSEFLQKPIRQERFGNPGQTIAGVITHVASQEQQDDEDDLSGHSLLIPSLLEDLASYGNKELLQEVAPKIPSYLLFANPRLVERFPSLQAVREILQNSGASVSKLANMIAEDPESFDEGLEGRVLKGEFGSTPDVLSNLLTILSAQHEGKGEQDEKREDRSLTMAIIFADLLAYTDRAKKMIPEIIKEDWYWQMDDSVAYSCFRVLNALDIPLGEEERFVWQNEAAIFKALRRTTEDEVDESNTIALDRIQQRGDFSEKLGSVLAGIRANPGLFRNLDADLSDELSNELLIDYVKNIEGFNEFLGATQEISGFLELFQEGRPLYGKAGKIIPDIIRHPRPVQRALEIESLFTRNVPYWKQVFLYVETVLRNELAFTDSKYPIRTSANFVIPYGERFDFTKHHQMEEENIAALSPYEKRSITVDGLRNLSDEEVDKMGHIPFKQLSWEAKRLTILNYLRKTIEQSQSPEAKQKADRRNREQASNTFSFSPGMYLHGSSAANLDSILFHGNLSGECLGTNARADSYPFHVDVHRISTQEAQQSRTNFEGVLGKTHAAGYGEIVYAYLRNKDSWERNIAYPAGGIRGDAHHLVLVGIPSTEISGILVKNPRQDIDKIKQAILENGVYIPVYDFRGKLLFTANEFDETTQEKNLNVPVEVWSTSLQVGDKKGSNEGGEFAISGEEGSRRFYVKYYPKEGQTDHLWTEQLADNVYRFMGIPVPHTQVVRVGDNFGHASELINPDEVKNTATLKDGFIVDALLANWDIVYNSNNTISLNSVTYRIDNGGAFHFKATGKKKESEVFGETVGELELGKDRQQLAKGMRQEYPGLTESDIAQQVKSLLTRLTPDAIASLVDGVRLSSLDRAYLKNVLNQRRNYIISRYKHLIES